jgi:hypothetical protein
MTGSLDTISSCYNYYISFLNGFESPEFNKFLDEDSIPLVEKFYSQTSTHDPGIRLPCPKFDYFETEILDKEDELIDAVNSLKFSFNNDQDIKFQFNQVYDSVIDITSRLWDKIAVDVSIYENKPIHFLNDIINTTLLKSLEKITDHIISHHKKYLYPDYKKKRSILNDVNGRDIFHRVENLINIDPLTRYHILAHKNYNNTIHQIPFLDNDTTIDTVKFLFRGYWAPNNFKDFDEEAISIENFFERDSFDFNTHPELAKNQLEEFQDILEQKLLAEKNELNFECFTIKKNSVFPDFHKSAELLNSKFPLCANYIKGQDYQCHLTKLDDDSYQVSFTIISNSSFDQVFSSKSFFFKTLYDLIRKEFRHPIKKYYDTDYAKFTDYILFILNKLDKYKKDVNKIINTLHTDYLKIKNNSLILTGKYFGYHNTKTIPFLTNISIYEYLVITLDNIIFDIHNRYPSIKYYALPGILPNNVINLAEPSQVYNKKSNSRSNSNVSPFLSFKMKNFKHKSNKMIGAFEDLVNEGYLDADKYSSADQETFKKSLSGVVIDKVLIWSKGPRCLHYYIDLIVDTYDLLLDKSDKWIIASTCFKPKDGYFTPEQLASNNHPPSPKHQKVLSRIVKKLK